MLNDREVKIHNLKVQRKAEERKLDMLDKPHAHNITTKGKVKAAVRSNLPKIDPALRVWHRPPLMVKCKARSKVAIPSAFPARNEVREYLRGERA